MKALFIILLILFSFAAKGQKIDIRLSKTIAYDPKNKDTVKHVHYFQWVSLPQCDMGNGRFCAVGHGSYSDCTCGAKATIENLFPGAIILDATYKKKN